MSLHINEKPTYSSTGVNYVSKLLSWPLRWRISELVRASGNLGRQVIGRKKIQR